LALAFVLAITRLSIRRRPAAKPDPETVKPGVETTDKPAAGKTDKPAGQPDAKEVTPEPPATDRDNTGGE
jgi:hypothetical protein